MSTFLESIYSQIFENLDQAFPEFEFLRQKNKWIAQQGDGLDRAPNKAKNHVCVYENNPSRLIDHRTNQHLSLWEYVQLQQQTNNFETLKYLANLAGIVVPINENLAEKFALQKRKSNLMEDANWFFIEQLAFKNTNAHAQKAREYLTQTRKYRASDFQLSEQKNNSSKMEIGFVPSQELLKKYLQEKKHLPEDIQEFMQSLPQQVGMSHIISLPFRTPEGHIKGFSFRHTQTPKENLPKYLNSVGIAMREHFFNLKKARNSKVLVVVEGQLDAWIASARDFEQVVAICGKQMSENQVLQAKNYGYTQIILCLDNSGVSLADINRNIELALKQGLEVFVAKLPEDAKDVDELLTHNPKGSQILANVLENSQFYYKFWADTQVLQPPYTDSVFLNDLEQQKFFELVANISANITNLYDQNLFFKYIEDAQQVAIWSAELRQKMKMHSNLIQQEKLRLQQKKQLILALNEGKIQANTQPVTHALQFLQHNIHRISQISVGQELPSLSFEEGVQKIRDTPQGLHSGYTALSQYVSIPQGAITLIAARPSHGKTTFMLNMMLNFVEQYPTKAFYFFSYEEPSYQIMENLLLIYISRQLNVQKLHPRYPNSMLYLESLLRNDAKLSNPYEEQIYAFSQMLNNRIFLIEKPYNVDELVKMLTQITEQSKNTGAIFVDYIQKIKTAERYSQRQLELQKVSQTILEKIAIGLNLPIILGAQVNREAISKGIPKLENLREADDLANDAKVVLTLLNTHMNALEEDDTLAAPTSIDLEVHIAKNRSGIVNKTLTLNFIPDVRNILDKNVPVAKTSNANANTSPATNPNTSTNTNSNPSANPETHSEVLPKDFTF